MGYYTRHQLTIVSGDDNKTDYEQEISNSTNYDNCFSSEIKWYDHEKDMKGFSLLHPGVLFLLDGEGEESGDVWKQYFKDGKQFYTKAKMVFEEFEESKLK